LYSKFTIAVKYLNYRAGAKSIFTAHSPFLYHLIRDCLQDKRYFYAFDDLKWSIAAFRLNRNQVQLTGLGARKSNRTTTVNAVLKSIKRPFKYYRLLFNLVNYFKPANIVELGTSFGLSTLMFSAGNPNARVHTIEGNDSLLTLARQNHIDLGYKQIRHLHGNFEDVLQPLLSETGQVDMVFIDGNHTKKATLNYFNQILPHCREKSILVFDDIHWSREMEQAWQTIISNQQITLSLDLFFMGIVFLNPELSKQHFRVRY
jgi:predicted O-methyltransferase YrrM